VRARLDAVKFRLKLAPLAPFTAGSGRLLGRFDYVLTVNPRTGSPLIRLIDIEKFIEESPLPAQKKVEAIEARSASVLERFSRCVLACGFRRVMDGLDLVEFHRGSDGQPIVPASSIKGMLRTAVGFARARREPARLRDGVEAAMEGRWRREGAAQRLERILFGPHAEIDDLRSLLVGEAAPATNGDMKAFEASVLTLSGPSLRPRGPLFVEALGPETGKSFEFPVAIDRALRRPLEERSGPAASGEPAKDPDRSLDGREGLLEALRGLSEAVIEGEKRFYGDLGERDLARLLSETLRRADGRIALPFGAGSGWRSKTLGALLGPAELQRLAPLLSPGRNYYRVHGRPVFPKSRRWILDGGRPARPLGWVTVE